MINGDIDKATEIHLLVALRRKKDNKDYRPMCLREILIDDITSLEVLKTKCLQLGGNWRIHRTINKRDTSKALRMFLHETIKNPKLVSEKLISVWKTCLMKRSSKAERNILLDIDSAEAYSKIREIIETNSIAIVEEAKSPSGYHIVINAEKVDTRLFTSIEDVTLQRDGYIFMEELNEKL